MPFKTTRRQALVLGGCGLLSGLAGCGRISSHGGSILSESADEQTIDLLRYLPRAYHEGYKPGFEFSVIGPKAAVAAQTELGAHKTSDILHSGVGEDGWVNTRDIEQQVTWVDADGFGYAFETPLDRQEILRRYQESDLQASLAGTFNEYTLIERPGTWDAVGDGVVVKIPTDSRENAERHLDNADTVDSSTMNTNIRTAIEEFDTRYEFLAAVAGEYDRTLYDSEIRWDGLFHAFSPNSDGDGVTLSTGIVAESPEAVTKWAQGQSSMRFIDIVHTDPTISRVGDMVVLTESGTTDHFKLYG